MKLSTAIMLGVISITFLALVGQIISIYDAQQALANNIGEHGIIFARDIINDIDRRINTRIEQFQVIALDEAIAQTMQESNKKYAQLPNINEHIDTLESDWTSHQASVLSNSLSQHLADIKLYYDRVYNTTLLAEIIATNKYGATIGITQPSSDFRQNDEHWWQQATTQGLYVGPVEYDDSANLTSIPIALRVLDENNTVVGTLKFVLGLDAIMDSLRDRKKEFPNNTQAIWLTIDNHIIYSTALYDFLEDANYKLPPHIRTLQIPQDGYTAADGHIYAYSVSAGFQKFEGQLWKIVLIHDQSDVDRAVATLRTHIFIYTLIFIILALTLGFYFARSISYPIKKMSSIVDDISKGNFNVQLPKKTSFSELESLANSFGRILVSLKLAVQKAGVAKEDIIEEAIAEKEKAQKKYKALFDGANDAIIITDITNRTIVDCNDQALKLIGKNADRIVGKNIDTLLPKDELDVFNKGFDEQAAGKHTIIETEILTQKTTIPVSISSSKFSLNGNEYLAGFFRDITERKTAEERMRIYLKGFETSPNSMLLAEYVDHNAIIRQVNKSFTDYYGYTAKEAIGKQPNIVKSGRQPKSYYNTMWKALLNPKIGYWRDEIINKAKNGKLLNVILTINTLFEDNKPKWFIASHDDITEMKEHHALHRTITEKNNACIKLIDNTGNLKYINPSGLREHKFKTIKSALGKNWLATIIPKQRQKVLRAIKTSIRTKQPQTIIIEHVKGKSTQQYCKTIITPLIDEAGKATGALCVTSLPHNEATFKYKQKQHKRARNKR